MNEKDKNIVFNGLIKAGVMRVEVHFSGGNDEGGADNLNAFDGEGNEIDFPRPKAHAKMEYNKETHQWNITGWIVSSKNMLDRKATPEEVATAELHTLLERPIYDEYYSFAGDFYVDGTLIWDVGKGEVYMERDEEVKSYEHSHLDI